MTVVDGCLGDGSTVVTGTGMDVMTAADGKAQVTRADAVVRVDTFTRVVQEVSTDDGRRTDALQALLGVAALASYRKVLARALPDDVAAGSLHTQLLDELPGVLLVVSGSRARLGLGTYAPRQEAEARLGDICAGWQRGGEMLRALTEGDLPYSGEGPWAGELDDGSDPRAWPAAGPLPHGSARRRRRIDLVPRPDGSVAFDALFRDSFIEPGGRESSVHEYGVLGTCDHDGRITALRADPHVLPGPQCPHAAASASRLIGLPLREVRDRVRAQFTGTSTCTHLNDTLRSLGACWPALSLLDPPGVARR